jgi:hypothetical protein
MPNRSKSGASISAAIITIVVLAGTASGLYLLRGLHAGQEISTVSIIGAVEDAKSDKPIPFARIQLETSNSEVVEPVYADNNGNFVIRAKSTGQGDPAILRVTAPGLEQTLHLDLVKSGRDHKPLLIQLAPQNSQTVPNSDQEPRHLTRTLGPVPSGYGANWSDWYRLCVEADEGYMMQRVSFALEGDRTCNGWAECQPAEQSATHACWRFRMQGHIEAFLGPGSVGHSTGKITAEEILAQGSRSDNSRYLINLQYHNNPTENLIVKTLRSELLQEGYTVPDPELLEKNYPTIVRFFHPEDRPVAETLRALVGTVSQRVASHALTPDLQDFSNQYSTLPGQIEIWLNLSRSNSSVKP